MSEETLTALRVQDEEDKWSSGETHPSFGLVGFTRTHGACRVHGSDIEHYDTITLTIRQGSVKRQYHREWHHEEKLLIQVRLSAEQFAGLLTTMNVGNGVPCTVEYTEKEGKIQFPAPPLSKREKFEADLRKKCEVIGRRLDALSEMLKEAKMPARERAVLQDELAAATRDIVSNMPFIQNSFNEAMDKTVTDAKAEVEAFYTGAVLRTGLTMSQVHAAERAALAQLSKFEQRVLEAEVIEGEFAEEEPPRYITD